VRHITLEVPLRAFAVVGRRQRRHAAHARVEPLGDALDDAALAGGVAPFKQNNHLVAGADHPVLQLHQLGLQAKQLAEILAAVFLVLDHLLRAAVVVFAGQLGHAAVFELHLQLFVVAVDQVIADTPHQFFVA
jgi:hypothetical protein